MKELIKFKMREGETDIEFSFMEPNKAVITEAEEVNSIAFADLSRKGYLTTHEVVKLYSERGGIFTKDEEEDFKNVLAEYLAEDKKLKDLPVDGTLNVELTDKVAVLKEKVLYYYNKQDSIFEKTAERKAREITLWHYALALVFKDGKPFFEGRDYKNRKKLFEDNFSTLKEEVLKRGIWYATAYVSGVKMEEVPYPESVSKPVAQ